MDTAKAPRADWWRDVVAWGRLTTIVTIVLGAALAIWFAIELGENDVFPPRQTLRDLIRQILVFIWYGAVVLIVAEIVRAVRGGDPNAGLINWQIPQATRVLAAVIIVGGTAVTIWDLPAMHDLYESPTGFLDFFGSGPGRTASDDIRYFLEALLQTYLWQGGLLILLAALVDRIGWRTANDALDGEEALRAAGQRVVATPVCHSEPPSPAQPGASEESRFLPPSRYQ